jgi:cell division transport system permease protein
VAWIDWGNAVTAIGYIAVVGFALTLLPTLVMTRKYLKV